MERKRKKTYLLIGLGVVALSATGAAYYFLNRGGTNSEDADLDFLTETSTAQFTLPEPNKASTGSNRSGDDSSNKSNFPLKRGSRGKLVQQLQEALMNRYGKSVLPKWGADGSWGSELDKALTNNNLPTHITKSLFQKFVGGSTGSSTSLSNEEAKKVAKNLRLSIIGSDFEMAKRVLGRIKNVSAYKKVAKIFIQQEIYGVRKTIVNGLLVKFNRADQKKQLNTAFHRIGLKYNGQQWTLSGIDSDKNLISVRRSTIWNKNGQSIEIKANTLLGKLIHSNSGVTEFRTFDNKQLFIDSKNTAYV